MTMTNIKDIMISTSSIITIYCNIAYSSKIYNSIILISRTNQKLAVWFGSNEVLRNVGD